MNIRRVIKWINFFIRDVCFDKKQAKNTNFKILRINKYTFKGKKDI